MRGGAGLERLRLKADMALLPVILRDPYLSVLHAFAKTRYRNRHYLYLWIFSCLSLLGIYPVCTE